jgi:hypothetical protein
MVFYGKDYEEGREVGQTTEDKLLIRTCSNPTKKGMDSTVSSRLGLWSKKTKI